MKSELIFFDSNVYIHALRSPDYVQKLEVFLSRAYLYVINKIVLMELWAGAKTKIEEDILNRLQQEFPLIGLSDGHFITAGKIMCQMRHTHKFEPKTCRQLTWDILIALSASENNACVITENESDFIQINKFLEFDFMAVQ